jgi:hypothetical protein
MPMLRDIPVQDRARFFVVQAENANGHSEMSAPVSATSAPAATERPMQ